MKTFIKELETQTYTINTIDGNAHEITISPEAYFNHGYTNPNYYIHDLIAYYTIKTNDLTVKTQYIVSYRLKSSKKTHNLFESTMWIKEPKLERFFFFFTKWVENHKMITKQTIEKI